MIVDVSEGMDGAGLWFALALMEVEAEGDVVNVALEADEQGVAVVIVEGGGHDLCWEVTPAKA